MSDPARISEVSTAALAVAGLIRAALCASDTNQNLDRWGGDDGVSDLLEVAEQQASALVRKVAALERAARPSATPADATGGPIT